MKLYEISNEIQSLIDQCIDHETGEVNPEIHEKLNQLCLAKSEKALNCARAIKNLSAEAVAIKSEIDNLIARKKQKESIISVVKKYLTANIAGEKYADSTAEISWRKSLSVEVFDETRIPISMKRHIPEAWEVDKIAIKAAISNGNMVCGAILRENINLQIK